MLLIQVNKWSFRLREKTAKRLANAIYDKLYSHADQFIGDWVLYNGLRARIISRHLDKLQGYFLRNGDKRMFIWDENGNSLDNPDFNIKIRMSGSFSHISKEWEIQDAIQK